MFKKALAHQSNATPIRSSARRQLVSSVFAQYPALYESVAAEGEEAAGKMSEKDLGRVLVPDSVRSANFETSAGVEGTMYISPDGDPLWMSFGRGSKDLVPTLSLLARLPVGVAPFPVLELPYPLPPPLLSGAALFLPAVRHLGKPWRLPAVAAGTIVTFVAPVSGDGVSYVGVGKVVAADGLEGALERLVKHRTEGVERDEGKFADILCIVDDHLWEQGTKPPMSSFPLPTPRQPLVAPPQTAEVDATVEGVAAVSLEGGDSSEPAIEAAAPLSPAEISTLLSAALLQTLATLPSGTLPLPASQLYSAHILPNRPAYIPAERRADVVIAKSEWKKLAKWMKEAAKDGLVKTKETKGEITVTSFDPKHPAIDGHVTFVTVSEDEAKAARRAAREAEAAEPSSTTMDIQELWKPAGSACDFWALCGVEKGSLNAPSRIKPLFDAYVEKNGLEDKEHRRVVELDKPLASAVGGKVGQFLVRDEVTRRLKAGVAWSVSVGGTVKKGALNPITMSVKTRQGRKQVTLVAGLEGFGVDPDDFAEELRRLCAGSTSVQPLTGASPKLNLKEVMVQGSQCKEVTEALLARGVPRRWIKDEGGKKK